jgi:hypothetical protein
MNKKTNQDVWKDCTGFLPKDFEKVQATIRTDSTKRFKRLGIIH